MTWHSYRQDGGLGGGIYGQLYDSSGNKNGNEFQINTYTELEQNEPSVAALTGAFGARIGFDFLDPAAAIVVGFMIGRFGIETLASGVRGITDQSLEDKSMLSKVKELILMNHRNPLGISLSNMYLYFQQIQELTKKLLYPRLISYGY